MNAYSQNIKSPEAVTSEDLINTFEIADTHHNVFCRYGKTTAQLYNVQTPLEIDNQTVNGWLALPMRDSQSILQGIAFLSESKSPIFYPERYPVGCVIFGTPAQDKPLFVVTNPEAAFAISQTGFACLLTFTPDDWGVKKSPNSNDCCNMGHVIKSWGKAGYKQIYAPVAIDRVNTYKILLKSQDVKVLPMVAPIDQYLVTAVLKSELNELIQNTIQSDKTVWGDPRPIENTLKPVAPFNAELLPEILRAWVMDEADRMPCPPDFIAVAALCALGIVIGARVGIKPKARDDWMLVPNLWGGVVASPSTKKSPAIAAAMKPLDRLIFNARQQHEEAIQDFELSIMAHNSRHDGLKDNLKKAGKLTEENRLAIARDIKKHQSEQPVAPVLRRYRTNDSTVESLGELERGNPNGILVLRDELIGLLASMDRDGKEGDRAFYLEGWNGIDSFDTDRILRGNINIENHCLSVFGGIQPDKLISYLESALHGLSNDGLLQRFQLLVYPDNIQWQYRDRHPNRAASDKVFSLFSDLDGLSDFDFVTYGAFEADEYNKRPYFRFNDEAQSFYIDWTTRLNQGLAASEDQPIIIQHLIKYEKLMPALALIFHLIDCVVIKHGGEVSLESAKRAAAWCDYLETHARRCYGLILDEGQRAAQALAEKILKIVRMPTDKTDETPKWMNEGLTIREIQRKQWRHLTQHNDVQKAIDWLVGDDWLRRVEQPSTIQGGRPNTRYFINPKILK